MGGLDRCCWNRKTPRWPTVRVMEIAVMMALEEARAGSAQEVSRREVVQEELEGSQHAP